MIKKKYIQAFDKSALLTSYCETSSELDQGIIELLSDREEYNLTVHHEKNSKSDHKFENS